MESIDPKIDTTAWLGYMEKKTAIRP